MVGELTVGILGPLEVRRGGTPLVVAAPKQRALLAMLALDAPGVVSTDVLIDRLWEGSPPVSAVTTVQVYVSQLRKLLGAGAIVTQPPGYRLDVAGEAVDAIRFDGLVSRGRAFLASGQSEAAREALEAGLGLWRGDALAEFVYAEWAGAPGQRLDELRVAAREDLMDARLEVGEARALVGELERLVAAYPLRERLRSQLMVALYRSGRQADALAVYQDARRVLVDGLGIDPSPALAELERRILQQDSTLGEFVPPSGGVGATAPPPAGEMKSTGRGSAGGMSAPSSPRRERKMVTVLFCDLVEFTSAAESSDPEDVALLLDRYYGMVRGEIERFGGVVEKFVGDAVMAVFGAPVVQEDDPRRAVLAGLAIVDRAAALHEEDPVVQLQVRIGVTTGEVLARLDPAAARGEAMVAGDVVNTASRLQALAPPGGVVVDAATRASSSQVIRYAESAPMVVKGKAEPVPVWVAAERLPVSVEAEDGAVPLVGRAHEFEAMVNAFSRMRGDESAQILSLVGVPGIGKTRLIVELRRYVDSLSEETTWRQGRSLAYGEGVAFWALGEIVKAQAGISEVDSGAVVDARLDECTARLFEDLEERAWVAGHLAALVGVDARASDGRGDRGEAFSAWRRFIEAMADERPTVLVFEDLHWADDALLDFIDLLADRITTVPLLIVSTARPEFLQRRPGWGGGKINSTILSLPPLGIAETEQLIAGFLSEDGLATKQRSQVIAQSEGNPLFVREYVRMLRDRGHETDTGGAQQSPIPATIHGLIAARLDALPAAEKQLAQVASVVGRVWWPAAAVEAGGFTQADTEDAIHQLEQRQLVRRSRRSAIPGQVELAFTHALIQDVAYHQIPRADRARHHQSVARWIEHATAEREDNAELLAHHLHAAAELNRQTGAIDEELDRQARESLRAAGDRATALGAYTTAARHYSSAMGLAAGQADETTAHILLALAKARLYTEDAFPLEFEAAFDLFTRLGDTHHAAEAEAYTTIWLLRHRSHDALRRATHAYTLLRPERVSPAKAFAVLVVGRITSERGDPTCLPYILEGLEIARELGSDELIARALMTLGDEHLGRDDPSGIAEIEECLRIATRLRSSMSALAQLSVVYDYVALGRLDDAATVCREGLAQARDMGLRTYAKGLELQQATLAFIAGDWAAAGSGVAAAPHSLDAEAVGGDEDTIAIRAVLALIAGDPERAARDAELAAKLCQEEAGGYNTMPIAIAAYVFAALDATDRAADLATTWLTSARDGRTFYTSFGCPFIANAFSRLGRHNELLEVTRGITIRTPWIEAAEEIASGRTTAAAEALSALGADALVELTITGIPSSTSGQ